MAHVDAARRSPGGSAAWALRPAPTCAIGLGVNERDLKAAAERWAQDDPDPETRAELVRLLAAPASSAEAADLADRFAANLDFGTAGLRGVLGAGPNRMNRAVVLRATDGLARHLLAAVPDARARGVAIGFDGRHMSREFAEDTACVLAAHGIRAFVFSDFAPTPLTAFAVHAMGAAAGVMVTASHNPPEYNGYKVYWGNAAQIVPPVDEEIARAIAAAPAARAVPRLSREDARAQGLWRDMPESVERDYLAAVDALQVHRTASRGMRIVYTPLHGVGGRLMRAVFDRAGFSNVTFVAEQEHPDPTFATVAFPNPEEKGAMDLAFAWGRKVSASLVVANDPDADRLAVAVPDPGSPQGFFQLTGNQVGTLLGHYLLTRSDGGVSIAPGRLVLASLVSSPMLGAIARSLGVDYEETLTGFKWIANRAMQLESERGLRFVFGYEEALGYTPFDLVRDKDGISSALLMAEMAAHLAAAGKTLIDAWQELCRAYGVYVSTQVSLTRPGVAGAQEIRALMDALRRAPPAQVGAHRVTSVSDYEAQSRVVLATGDVAPIALPKSNVLAFELEGGSRIIARPSGTEPKVKFYFDLREPMAEGETAAAAEKRARESLGALAAAWSAEVSSASRAIP
jgi:phosphomannomutase